MILLKHALREEYIIVTNDKSMIYSFNHRSRFTSVIEMLEYVLNDNNSILTKEFPIHVQMAFSLFNNELLHFSTSAELEDKFMEYIV